MHMITEGKRRPITCPECGCRLATSELFEDVAIAYHFLHDNDSKRDAQSHLCSYIGVVWNIKFRDYRTGEIASLVAQ